MLCMEWKITKFKLASVLFSLAVFACIPLTTYAATDLQGSLSTSGDYSHEGSPTGTIPSGMAGTFSSRMYNGFYPDTSDPVSGSGTYCSGFDASWQSDPYETFLETTISSAVKTQATTTGSYWYAICQDPTADTPTGSVVDYFLAFEITSDGDYVATSDIQIYTKITPNTPENYQFVGSTTSLTLSTDVTVGNPLTETPDEICMILWNVTNNQAASSSCLALTTSGTATYDFENTEVEPMKTYSLQYFITDDGYRLSAYDKTIRFYTFEQAVYDGQYTDFLDSEYSTTSIQNIQEQCSEYDDANFITKGLCKLAVFLLIPGDVGMDRINATYALAQQKVPFAYIDMITNAVESIPETISTTTPALSIAMFDEDISILEQDGHTQYFGVYWNSFYFLMKSAIWVLLGFALWNLRYKLV